MSPKVWTLVLAALALLLVAACDTEPKGTYTKPTDGTAQGRGGAPAQGSTEP